MLKKLKRWIRWFKEPSSSPTEVEPTSKLSLVEHAKYTLFLTWTERLLKYFSTATIVKLLPYLNDNVRIGYIAQVIVVSRECKSPIGIDLSDSKLLGICHALYILKQELKMDGEYGESFITHYEVLYDKFKAWLDDRLIEESVTGYAGRDRGGYAFNAPIGSTPEEAQKACDMRVEFLISTVNHLKNKLS